MFCFPTHHHHISPLVLIFLTFFITLTVFTISAVLLIFSLQLYSVDTFLLKFFIEYEDVPSHKVLTFSVIATL